MGTFRFSSDSICGNLRFTLPAKRYIVWITTGFLRGGPLQSSIGKFEAERAELDAILSSGMFGRTNNLVRLLTYVCEKHFEGATGDIKEYNIAVQALGRPSDFDPQVDTIVRVTAHALRKRLDDYYRSEGADHTIRIALPPGGYIPKFTRINEIEAGRLRAKLSAGETILTPNGSPGRDESLHGAGQEHLTLALEPSRCRGMMPKRIRASNSEKTMADHGIAFWRCW